MKEFTTVCPRNCYSTCSLNVFLNEETQRIHSVEVHPANKATPFGPCLKGISYVERQYSPLRIMTPLRKNPENGEFRPIGWDEALSEIVARLERIKDQFGPQALFFYSASGTKGLMNMVGTQFWRLFGGYTGTYGDLCWPAGLEATRLTLGTNKHNVPWDIENAGLIVLWGKNAAETNVQQMQFIDQAQKKGTKLVVIDSRRTITADKADLFLQPRPGTDGALALGICRELIRTGHVNLTFIDAHVLGYKEFADSITDWDLPTVNQVTGVSVRLMNQLVEHISEEKPITICPGFGMQRYSNSGQTMRSMLAILVITGNIGRPGCGWMYANLQSDIFHSVKDPLAFFPPDKPDGVARISVSTARLGKDLLDQRDPPVKMAWVERGNPITQNPDTHTVIKAFRQMEFRVVVEQFMTDTAREADIVLPAKTLFEQSDLIGAYWHSYIQLKQKLVEPPAGVKPESEIYRALAHRLGFGAAFDRIIPGPEDDQIEAFLEKKLKQFPDISLKELKKGPVLAPGTEEVAFADLVFATPSGKIELFSEEAAQRWRVNALPSYVETNENYQLKPGSTEFEFYYLMTPNTKNRIHSQFNNLDLIRQFGQEPEVSIHPQDAMHLGIRSGDRVTVFNKRGELTLKTKLDFSLKAGCLSITNGWWIQEGGTVNFLSPCLETDMGYGAAFHDNLVQIKKVAP